MTLDFREFGQQAQALGLAVAVHVLAALFMVLGTMNWVPFKRQEPVGLLIEAVMVDTSMIQDQRAEAQAAAEREEMREQRARELEQQREREQQRQQELEDQRREQQRVEQQRAEEQRQQELEAQRKREAEQRLEQLRQERERKLEEERIKQQRELEQLRAEREAAERDRREAEERLKQIEAQRQREAEQQRLAAEQEAQRVAAEQQAFQAGRLATERDKYMLAIQQVVTQNWLRPPTAEEGLVCVVNVVQIPGGEVISANIGSPCNADPVTRRSIIAAVERAGTLPYRGFEQVFERNIQFNFIYDGN